MIEERAIGQEEFIDAAGQFRALTDSGLVIIGFQGILGRDGPPRNLSELPSGAKFSPHTSNLLHMEEATQVLLDLLYADTELEHQQYWVYDRNGPVETGKELWYSFLG